MEINIDTDSIDGIICNDDEISKFESFLNSKGIRYKKQAFPFCKTNKNMTLIYFT